MRSKTSYEHTYFAIDKLLAHNITLKINKIRMQAEE